MALEEWGANKKNIHVDVGLYSILCIPLLLGSVWSERDARKCQHRSGLLTHVHYYTPPERSLWTSGRFRSCYCQLISARVIPECVLRVGFGVPLFPPRFAEVVYLHDAAGKKYP